MKKFGCTVKWSNYHDRKRSIDRIERVIGESCTIPDQSLSIKEILQKFVSGIDPQVGKQVIYEENANIDAPTNLVNFDPTDVMTKYEKDCD